MILALQKAIELDLGIELKPKNIARKIYKEVKNCIHFYSEFVLGQNQNSIMKDVKYLHMKDKCYDMPVVDLILGAATDALNVNISTVQRSNENVKTIEFQPTQRPSTKTLYLLFHRDSNPGADPNNLNSHYDTLILDKCTKPVSVKTETETKTESISFEIENKGGKDLQLLDLANVAPRSEEPHKVFFPSNLQSATDKKVTFHFH